MRTIDDEVMNEHEHEPFDPDCPWQDIGGEG